MATGAGAGAPTELWRRARLLVLAITGVVVLGIGWLVATGVSAWSQMHSARNDVHKIEEALLSGHPAEARRLGASLKARAASAHARTSGPAWWVAAHVPWAGAPLESWRETASALDGLANRGLPPVLNASSTLSPDRLLSGPSTIDLTPIKRSVVPLQQAARAVDAVRAELGSDQPSTWFGAVDKARRRVDGDLTQLRQGFAHAVQAAQLVPGMLGESGPRRYFVAFENEAEARGLGGLPGAYGILRVEDGHFKFVRFGSQYDLLNARSTARLGGDFRSRYSVTFHSDSDFRNSDASPHFPYVAATWLSMWENEFHQHLDGALVTDPTALSYLMKSSGSVTLSDGQKLVAANAAQVLESGIYQKFPGLSQSAIAARKDYLVAAAQTLVDFVTAHVSDEPGAMFAAMKRSASERRLLIYSARPDEERELARTPVGGVLSATKRPFVGLIINNTTGSKLDYYLDQRLSYSRASCAAGTATVTVRLHNDAPATGLPPYVTYTSGLLGHAAPGTNRDLVSLYLTHGAELRTLSLDGHRAFLTQDSERGHPVVSLNVTFAPGQTRTLVYKVREPAATGPVVVPVQPLVRGLLAKVDAPRCIHD